MTWQAGRRGWDGGGMDCARNEHAARGPLGGGPCCTFERVAQSEEGVRADRVRDRSSDRTSQGSARWCCRGGPQVKVTSQIRVQEPIP